MRTFIYTFTAVLLLIASSVLFSSCTAGKDDNGVPALLERKTTLGTPAETQQIRDSYDSAIVRLKKNPDDMRQYIALAQTFIQEGRITGNGTYYSNAAVKMLDKAISSGNKDQQFISLSLKSAVLMNQHQFKDALAVAQQAIAMNPYNSGVYGALVDANEEMGNYQEAVKDCDKMLQIRPDLRSYSRASYLRQIFGDNRGAIDAMIMAVQAGLPGLEATEWCRVNLGDLYLNTGNIDSASIVFRTSLVYRPDYPAATMGMARVARAMKAYDSSLSCTKRAITIQSEVAYVSFLGDIYELKGDNAKAAEVRKDVINLLEEAEKDQPKDALIKHNVSREMATAYLNNNDLDKAMQYAATDLAMRPDNIDANELIAWIYYLKGDMANAKLHADKMLATNTKNANTLYKAGIIYTHAGDAAKGTAMMQQAKAISPYIDERVIKQGDAVTMNKG